MPSVRLTRAQYLALRAGDGVTIIDEDDNEFRLVGQHVYTVTSEMLDRMAGGESVSVGAYDDHLRIAYAYHGPVCADDDSIYTFRDWMLQLKCDPMLTPERPHPVSLNDLRYVKIRKLWDRLRDDEKAAIIDNTVAARFLIDPSTGGGVDQQTLADLAADGDRSLPDVFIGLFIAKAYTYLTGTLVPCERTSASVAVASSEGGMG